jgi:hypothetical protein
MLERINLADDCRWGLAAPPRSAGEAAVPDDVDEHCQMLGKAGILHRSALHLCQNRKAVCATACVIVATLSRHLQAIGEPPRRA